MAGVNKVILVGNLGADPEARSLNNGGEVVNLRVATSENWKDKDGNRQERTEWHNVVIFNENLGRVAKSYLKKGSKVYVEGQIQTRKWTDQSGQDRYSTEVVLQRFRGELVLLDSREGGGGGRDMGESGGGYGGGGGGSSRPQSRPQPAAFNDLDDDVPPPVTDWETYGGITRSVTLITVPETFVDDAWIRLGRDGRIHADIRLYGHQAQNRDLAVRIPALGLTLSGRTDQSGSWSGSITAPRGLKRWSPETPALYDVQIESGTDVLHDRIGFRTIETRGTQILLNGKPVFLRGISMHEEELGKDPVRAITPAAARALLTEIKQGLNGNFVRLAHCTSNIRAQAPAAQCFRRKVEGDSPSVCDPSLFNPTAWRICDPASPRRRRPIPTRGCRRPKRRTTAWPCRSCRWSWPGARSRPSTTCGRRPVWRPRRRWPR